MSHITVRTEPITHSSTGNVALNSDFRTISVIYIYSDNMKLLGEVNHYAKKYTFYTVTDITFAFAF